MGDRSIPCTTALGYSKPTRQHDISLLGSSTGKGRRKNGIATHYVPETAQMPAREEESKGQLLPVRRRAVGGAGAGRTCPCPDVQDLLRMGADRRVEQRPVRELQHHGVLHVLPLLLHVVVGYGVAAVLVAVVPPAALVGVGVYAGRDAHRVGLGAHGIELELVIVGSARDAVGRQDDGGRRRRRPAVALVGFGGFAIASRRRRRWWRLVGRVQLVFRHGDTHPRRQSARPSPSNEAG